MRTRACAPSSPPTRGADNRSLLPKLPRMAGSTRSDEDAARQIEDLGEQQRAISGVLRAVARSAGLQPVLDEVVEAAGRLCDADQATLYLLDHGLLHSAAYYGDPPSAEYDRQHPHALDRTTGAGRTAITGEPVHIPDITADPDYGYGGPPRRAFSLPLAARGRADHER